MLQLEATTKWPKSHPNRQPRTERITCKNSCKMHLYKIFHFAELQKDKPWCCISPTAAFHHRSFPYLTFTQLGITATSENCT